jgi:hypothetical protein
MRWLFGRFSFSFEPDRCLRICFHTQVYYADVRTVVVCVCIDEKRTIDSYCVSLDLF